MVFDWHSGHLVIETTNFCNANCVICPRDKMTRKKAIMSFDLFKKIVDDASQYEIKYVDMHGFGEPLLDPDLFKKMDYLKKKIPNAKIHISSTCFLLNKEKYANVLKYVDTLKISFFGMTKDTYEKMHGGNIVFEKSLSNILSFLKAKGNNPKPYIIGLFVLTDNNRHEVDDWLNFWKPKLDEVMVWNPHNWVDFKDYRKFNHLNQISCGRPIYGPPFVLVDGKVSICCLDANNRLEIGDINKQSFAEIFQSKDFQRIRNKHLAKDFRGLVCYNCEQTNPKDSDLVYASNKKRKIGMMLAGTNLGVRK